MYEMSQQEYEWLESDEVSNAAYVSFVRARPGANEAFVNWRIKLLGENVARKISRTQDAVT